MKKLFGKIIILLLSALGLFYFMLPSINIHDAKFYFYVFILLVELMLLLLPDSIKESQGKGAKYFFKHSPTTKVFTLTCVLIVASLLYVMISAFAYSPVFNAKAYANRIQVKQVEFSEVPKYNFNTTAIIDRKSSEKLGDKVMGEMTDLVSQFVVSDEYRQIDYDGGTYRVTPLAYDGVIKYFKNSSRGIPGYIIVNTTTGEAKLNRLDKTMHYVPSAMFSNNLYRKLRFDYPTVIFGDPSFEIDDEGNPYYVCTTYTFKGITSLKKVTGLIVFNPVDGTSQKYGLNDIPKWVDRVFPESLVITELDNYGQYQKGFWNATFGQEGVIQTSEGYNYISKNGDVWLYTGVTSVVSDESNIGFMLVNLRTHEAEYIVTSGADEYAVMESAEGEVLNYGYTATFPVLVNIDNKPIYILSLKDSAGLVKMYAMVDAQDYQQVYTVKADKDAKSAIDQLIKEATGVSAKDESEYQEASFVVELIKETVIDGNTYLYIYGNNDVYVLKMSLSLAPKALGLKAEDEIKVTYEIIDGNKYINSIK